MSQVAALMSRVLSSEVARRLVLPAVCALAIIGTLELFIELRYQPGFWQKSTYLLHDAYKGEPFDRSEVYVRLGHAEDADPDIISVGDSSGFFSLQSKIVSRYTHGKRFISLNTGANHAFDGYRAIAEYMLRRSPHLKHVVLYIYPQLTPTEAVFHAADLGIILRDDLVSIKSWVTPPSAFLSPYAKARMLAGSSFHFGDLVANHLPAQLLVATVDEDLGWLPEFDVRFDRVDGRSPFYPDGRAHWYQNIWSDPSTVYATFDDFNRMVRSYGANLIIAFAPLSTRITQPGDPNLVPLERVIERFQKDHPEVKFLFPFRTRWSPEKFGMFNHISREYTFLSSERLGAALGKLIADPDAIAPFKANLAEQPPYPEIKITPSGPSDPALLESSLAFFRYTTTADDATGSLISERVLDLLGKIDSYKYMMELTRARIAALKRRNITIGFDLSQLRATPVTVTGLSHCAPRGDTQWVHVEGSMIFTYDSPSRVMREPVSWPAQSRILFPTVVENGIRKFDGYCPESDPEGLGAATPAAGDLHNSVP